MVELLISPVAAGIFGLISLVVGKRIDNHMKTSAEQKALARKQDLEYRQQLDNRHDMLFKAFVEEQKKAAVAFEGIHQSVTHIGEELAEMSAESKTYRAEIFTRIKDLESTTARHDGVLQQMDRQLGQYKL